MNGDPDHTGRTIPGRTIPTRTIADVWRADNEHVRAVAIRILRDPAAADDAVQEAFGRLAGVDLDGIDDPRGWLTVAVRRLCLNRLASATSRRESSVDAPPDGAASVTAPPGWDPADRVTLDDQVQRALAVVLDRLSPAERTSFVLHDVFGFPFGDIATMVGRTPAACRQLASRARGRVRGTEGAAPTPNASDPEHRTLVERFVAACGSGDLTGLVALLDPDADTALVGPDGRTLGGGAGARRVAEGALRFLGPGSGSLVLAVAGEAGVDIVARYANGACGLLEVVTSDGLITAIRGTVTGPPSGPPAGPTSGPTDPATTL